MPYKPLTWQNYVRWIEKYGWSVKKAGTDLSLLDADGNYVCTINKAKNKDEVPAFYVRKTKAKLKDRGLEQ